MSFRGYEYVRHRSDQQRPRADPYDVGQEFPDWHCYAPGIDGTVFASLRRSAPLVIVRGADPVTLREEIRSWMAAHGH